jgi:tRNA G46 methylase TrmB
VVLRHLETPSRRPIAPHTARAFEALREVLAEAPLRPLVFDFGCGTGASTHRLAHLHPAAWVIGVDQSAHRLGVSEGLRRHGERVVLLRAEQTDLWRLLAHAGFRLGASYLLYPNPWPKARHLGRRVHGHPAFPALLALGGRLEVRSNWPTYVEELAQAVRLVTGASAAPRRVPEDARPLSPFERKYQASGHALFALGVCLRPRSLWPPPRAQQGVAASHASRDSKIPLESS